MRFVRKLLFFYDTKKHEITKGKILLENGGFILLENGSGYILTEK